MSWMFWSCEIYYFHVCYLHEWYKSHLFFSNKMHISVLPCLYLLTFPVQTHTTSEFWTKAQQTLILSQTRSDLPPPTLTVPTRDPILDNPRFLPLCGNGRIDTKADYADYYLSNPPLSLTKQQILYARNDVVNPNMLHNVTIMADEECDDGNRLDLDGCSADCMHVDAWTSSCEIAVEVVGNDNNKALVYEDIIYDPARNAMVVSALDGIYSLDLAVGDAAVKARLIVSKSFSVTNIFRRLNSLILYSNTDQTFWQLLDGDSSISLQRNLSQQGYLTEWNDNGHCNADGSIIVHDSTMMLFFTSPSATPIMCNNPNGYIMQKCVFVQILDGVQISQQGASLFQCTSFNATITVIIGPLICTILAPQSTPSDSRSMLYDVMDMTRRQTGMFAITPYNMVVNITPPQTLDAQLKYAQYYTPWGVLIESPIASARKWGSAAASPNQLHFLGDPSIVSMLTLQDDGNCGPTPCGLDTKLQYDILDPNPLKNTVTTTWGDVLQDKIIREAAKTPILLSISAIKADAARYSSVLSAFNMVFKQVTDPLTVRALQTHPVTHNLWALRSDRLVEISKSGVQLQRQDGKCLPSGIALCPACQWAPSGSKCRPCAQADANSWAWSARCKNRVCTNGRRLLAAETSIRFTLTGNQTVITSYWPGAVRSGLLYVIVVSTTDPIAEMRLIRERLALITSSVQAVTQPYEIVLVDETTLSNTPSPQSDNTAQVVVGIVVPVLIIISLVIPYSVNRANHFNDPKRASVMQYPAYTPYRRVPVHAVPGYAY